DSERAAAPGDAPRRRDAAPHRHAERRALRVASFDGGGLVEAGRAGRQRVARRREPRDDAEPLRRGDRAHPGSGGRRRALLDLAPRGRSRRPAARPRGRARADPLTHMRWLAPGALAFAAVGWTAAMNGGYFPDSWGWPTLVFLILATGAAVVGERVVLRRLDIVLLGALAAFTAWTALSALW